MLRYPLKCAHVVPADAHFSVSQQPMMIEPCFNFLNTLPVCDESVCNIRIYLYRKKLFYNFCRLKLVECGELKLDVMSVFGHDGDV